VLRKYPLKHAYASFSSWRASSSFTSLGNRISLISKKNIRYEGTLYSINESDATVALQNVKSYGTEGREKTEEGCTFVPPQDAVHPYLLFRGCDIKDLHVHEQPKPAEESPNKETPIEEVPPAKQEASPNKEVAKMTEPIKTSKQPRPRQSNKAKAQVGTGASLLNRKERGTVDGGELSLLCDYCWHWILLNHWPSLPLLKVWRLRRVNSISSPTWQTLKRKMKRAVTRNSSRTTQQPMPRMTFSTPFRAMPLTSAMVSTIGCEVLQNAISIRKRLVLLP